MDTRTEDLALLRQVREKTNKLAELRNSIHEKKSELESLRTESRKPENYNILPTDNYTTLNERIEVQSSKSKSKALWISFAIAMLLTIGLFVFTIIWLANCPEDAYIRQTSDGGAILFWIGHIFFGLIITVLPAIFKGVYHYYV